MAGIHLLKNKGSTGTSFPTLVQHTPVVQTAARTRDHFHTGIASEFAEFWLLTREKNGLIVRLRNVQPYSTPSRNLQLLRC